MAVDGILCYGQRILDIQFLGQYPRHIVIFFIRIMKIINNHSPCSYSWSLEYSSALEDIFGGWSSQAWSNSENRQEAARWSTAWKNNLTTSASWTTSLLQAFYHTPF